jgi:hypothetical protein
MKKITNVLLVCGVILVISLSGCGKTANNQGQSSKETYTTGEVKEKELPCTDFEENGITYRKEQHSDFEIIYPLNDKEVFGKELICGESGKKEGEYDVKGNRYIKLEVIYLPQLFQDEEIKRITFTLQNCPGAVNGIKKGQNGYQMESKPVTYSYDEQKNVYISILKEFEGNDYPSTKEEVRAFREAIENAVIQAELSYIDGTTKTTYIGMETTSEYSNNYLNYYILTME